jgi:MSHA pilin protein MshA
MFSTRRGFTFVELSVAAVAVGWVSALAMPHLSTDREREQRIAKLHAARSAVVAAAALMRGAARSRAGQAQLACLGMGYGSNPPLVDAAGDGNLCTDNGRVQVARFYPAPTLAGIVASAGLVPVSGTPSAAQLAHDGYAASATVDGLRVQVNGGRDAVSCAFTYRGAVVPGGAPEISAAVTSGC